MQIRFRYNFLKSLIKQYRKQLPSSNDKKINVKFAVREEIRKLRYINKISNNYEKRNVVAQIVYEEEIDISFNRQGHFLRHQQLHKENRRMRNKIQKEISDSVRDFMREKMLIKKIENKN